MVQKRIINNNQPGRLFSSLGSRTVRSHIPARLISTKGADPPNIVPDRCPSPQCVRMVRNISRTVIVIIDKWGGGGGAAHGEERVGAPDHVVVVTRRGHVRHVTHAELAAAVTSVVTIATEGTAASTARAGSDGA